MEVISDIIMKRAINKFFNELNYLSIDDIIIKQEIENLLIKAYKEGKSDALYDMSDSYQKGYESGWNDGYENARDKFETVKKGLTKN